MCDNFTTLLHSQMMLQHFSLSVAGVKGKPEFCLPKFSLLITANTHLCSITEMVYFTFFVLCYTVRILPVCRLTELHLCRVCHMELWFQKGHEDKWQMPCILVCFLNQWESERTAVSVGPLCWLIIGCEFVFIALSQLMGLWQTAIYNKNIIWHRLYSIICGDTLMVCHKPPFYILSAESRANRGPLRASRRNWNKSQK